MKSEPVFPLRGDTDYGATGMTLRDWFAGQALPALIASYADLSEACVTAWWMADQMLKAQKEENE